MYSLLKMGDFPLPAMLVYWRVTQTLKRTPKTSREKWTLKGFSNFESTTRGEKLTHVTGQKGEQFCKRERIVFQPLHLLFYYISGDQISFLRGLDQVGVSKKKSTPKLSILIGFSIIFTIHFGVPVNLETPKWRYQLFVSSLDCWIPIWWGLCRSLLWPTHNKATSQLYPPLAFFLIKRLLATLPETNSKFAPENWCLEYDPFLWDGLFSGANC